MTIGRKTDFPYPEKVDSIENMGQYLKSLYRTLTQDQIEKITDFEDMVYDSIEVGNLTIVTSFKPTVDNVVDIGATTLRFKDLYLSGSLKDDTVSLTVAHAKDAYDKRVDTWGDGLQYSTQTASVDYNTNNLKITSTELNTIQDIDIGADVDFATVTADTIFLESGGLRIEDTNQDYYLKFAVGSDLSASKTLTFTTGDADRTITLSGNPTLSDWFDQAVKVASTPTLAGLTIVNAITEFSTDGTMGGNSDSAIPTERSVVSYIGAFHALTNEPTGFENRTDSTLSWGATRTLTIAPSNGSFDLYQEGTKYTKGSSENIQILNTSGVHYIYYDAGTLTVDANPSSATIDTIYEIKPLVALVYWNATDSVAYILGDERHGFQMDGVTHRLMHNTDGALWGDGLTLSGYTLDTGSDAALNFEVTDGTFFDQDITHNIIDGTAANQYEQQLNGGDAVVPILYRDDVDATWKEDAASTLPYKVTGTGRLAYNNDDGDGTFSQIEVTDNKFMSITLAATHDWQYPVKMIQGQNEYTDKKTAVQEALSEILSFGDLPTPEMTFLYRLVMQTKDTFGGTKKAKIVDVTDLRGSLVTGSTAVAVDHGVLSGLADDDHNQYILHSLADAANDFLVASADDAFAKQTSVEVMATLSGAAGAAFAWNSQNLTGIGTIACGNTTVTGTLTATSTVTIPTALTGVIRADSGVLSVEGTAVLDADFGSAGLCATNGSGTYSIVTDNSATWDALVTESTTVTAPLALSTYDISIPVAATAADGYLAQADWNTFNGKEAVGHNMSTHGDEDTYAINTSGTLTAGNATLGTISTTGQIAFPASQNASANANTQDDYEEGTWTPTGVLAVPGTSSQGASAGNYQKTGNTVHVQGNLIFLKGNGTGTFTITGLPFTNGAGHEIAINFNWYQMGVANEIPNAFVATGGTTIQPVMAPQSVAAYNNTDNTDLGATVIIRISTSFPVA